MLSGGEGSGGGGGGFPRGPELVECGGCFFVDPFAASECALLFLEVGFGLFLCGERFGVFFSGVVAVAGDPFGFSCAGGAFADSHSNVSWVGMKRYSVVTLNWVA